MLISPLDQDRNDSLSQIRSLQQEKTFNIKKKLREEEKISQRHNSTSLSAAILSHSQSKLKQKSPGFIPNSDTKNYPANRVHHMHFNDNALESNLETLEA